MVTVRWGIAPVACANWHSLSINNIVTPAVLVEVCTLLSVILVFSLFSLILCFWFHVVVLRCIMSVFVCMLNIMYRILWWFYLSSFFSVNWECVVNCVCVCVCTVDDVNDKCSFAALLGYASSQLKQVVNSAPADSSCLRHSDTVRPRRFALWRDRGREMV